ncbi:rRNA primary transcript metabolism protein [Desmophyllum pertusum]|uniref:rRNA primary transcript metabolism protein n=1 Tax=Desmophyllum pertusum TaxID=174260 RepID=A0A9W9Z4T8_9CNID|nr:rRNA primary transcript metabolism protein [Desmophyllum pertusum]
MKSSSKGIYSKLKDSTVEWDEKLSLARHAWESADCVIPNKQQVLLDWIVQELISGYKKGVKAAKCELLNGLWKLLLDFLQSQKLFAPAKLPVTLKPQLLQVFTDIFLSKDSVSNGYSRINVIINCCYTVVSSPQLATSMLAKFESYVSFLSALLAFFVPICLKQSKDLHLLVEVCLEKYLVVQRQQANQRKTCTDRQTCRLLVQTCRPVGIGRPAALLVQTCRLTCTDWQTCSLTCTDLQTCRLTCTDRQTCRLTCTDLQTCRLTCTDRQTCRLTCTDL